MYLMLGLEQKKTYVWGGIGSLKIWIKILALYLGKIFEFYIPHLLVQMQILQLGIEISDYSLNVEFCSQTPT